MNAKIRKLVRNSRKKFIRSIVVRCDVDMDAVRDLLNEFGLFTYCDPSTEGDIEVNYLVSNRRMTVGDFVNWYTVTNDGDKWAQKAFKDDDHDAELEIP